MKKIIFGFICLFCLTMGANAASVDFVYPSTVRPGERFTVKVVIKDAVNMKYVKGTNYRFDNSKITVNDYDGLSGFVGTGDGDTPLQAVDGNLGYVLNNQTAKSGNVDVFFITYTANSSLTTGDTFNIRFDRFYVGNSADGSDATNISSDDHCITIGVSGNTVVPNPPTGVNSTIVVVISALLLVTGCYLYFSKKKLYY